MKHLKWLNNKNKHKNNFPTPKLDLDNSDVIEPVTKLHKSDYTFAVDVFSKIDPSKKIIINYYMKCPVCGEKMEDMEHGEVRVCKSCKTRMQTFGNALRINIDASATNSFDRYKKQSSVVYTKTHTTEMLDSYDYFYNRPTNINKNHTKIKIKCPLCGSILDLDIINYKCNLTCTCNLDIKYDSGDIRCTIDNDTLELYRSVEKYNI